MSKPRSTEAGLGCVTNVVGENDDGFGKPEAKSSAVAALISSIISGSAPSSQIRII